MNDLKNIIEDVNKSEFVSNKVIKKIIEIIGQEKWHELHDEYNDVITTTGELAICLRSLEDLEQENEQLKAQVEKMKCCYLCKSVYDCAFADVFNFHSCDKWEIAE